MSWFLIQSWLFILLAFLLGLLVAYLWWHRRLRKVKVSESRVVQTLTSEHRTELTERDRLAAELRRANDGLQVERDRAVTDLATSGAKVATLASTNEALQADLANARANQANPAETAALASRLAAAEADHASARDAAAAAAAAASAAAATPIQGLVGVAVWDDVGAAVGDDSGDDELERIEGIGPRFGAALRDAGIRTFARLASSPDEDLKRAVEAAGLSFAPSLGTWATQAGFLARGDEAGFRTLTDQLAAGRDPGGAN